MWGWDSRALRYRDTETGRFIAEGRILDWVNENVIATRNAVQTLVFMYDDGLLNANSWYVGMRNEIKSIYISNYLSGIGGIGNMTQADWGSIGGMIADQYRYLGGYFDSIEDMSLNQMLARSKMYANSAKESYYRGLEKSLKRGGYNEEIWIVDPSIENCDDCLSFEDEGWQEIGYFPMPGQGQTKCLTNCGCEKEYRNAEGEIRRIKWIR